MPKIIDRDKVRREIADKALAVFIGKGYHRARLSDIASRCQLSRTNLYQYFKSKDELFRYVLHLQLDEIGADYSNILIRTDLTNLEKIKALITFVFREYYQKKEILLMLIDFWLRMTLEGKDMLSELNKRTLRLQQVLKELLDKGVRKEEIIPINTKRMSMMLFSVIKAFLVQAALSEDISLADLTESTLVLLDGLEPHSEH